MSKIAVSSPASGTATYTISAPAGSTDRTLTLPDNTGTILTTATAGVPVNGPAFGAYANTNGSAVASNTFTKVIFGVEAWDTNSCFASSRFTPTVAGYYQLNSCVQLGSVFNGFIAIFKNGADYKRGMWTTTAGLQEATVSAIVDANGSTDYFEIYIYQSVAGNIPQGIASVTYFDGAMLRSAT